MLTHTDGVASMRVLIVSASYGSGHNAAAQSLAAAFGRQGVTATIVDHFDECVAGAFARVTRALYETLLRRAGPVWTASYWLGDHLASDSPLTLGLTRLGATALRARIETLTPDAIVTVHPTPAVAVSWLATRGVRVPPHTTVFTDFVTHSQWIAPRIDRYCVPAVDTRDELLSRGIPADRIAVTGMPLRPAFDEAIDAVDARTLLGLPVSSPVVLAMAGSDASLGRLPDVARVLARLDRPISSILVAGRSRALADRLSGVADGVRAMHVLGYVEDVRTLMAAADVLVTKAGGLTLAEAIAAEVPLVLYGSLPGQERRNEAFAARHGLALVARTPDAMAHAITHVLDAPAVRADLRARLRRARTPGASRAIVDAVLERAPFGRRAAPPDRAA